MFHVVLAADAAPGQGLGHLSRSSALAAALAAGGHRPRRCLALGAEDPTTVDGIEWEPAPRPDTEPGDVLVLDSYTFDAAAVTDARALAVFHDDGPAPDHADLVIAPALPATDDRRVLAGLEHACLREAYWDLPARDVAPAVASVLVTTGGADPGGAGAPLAVAIATRLPGARVALVRGPQAATADPPPGVTVIDGTTSLTDALCAADLVVTAAGQTLLEALATGAPTISLALVANQEPIAAQLAERGATLTAANIEDAAERTARLAQDEFERRRLSAAGRTTVDGRGAHRVAARVAKLAAS